MRSLIAFFTLLFLPFQLLIGQTNACLESQQFKIVILGSSTAAGAGVSTPDSAWVNRYREYVQGVNPNNEVINLAVGGFNTYKIMPSGFVPPINRPLSDTNKNITKAISLNPDAIIVNLPSNDISSGFSVSEQLLNFDLLFTLANSNNISIWICTTQPVNYSDSQKRQLQEDLKDSIQLIYGSFSINFWDTIALPDNSIDPVYNTDGTHLNDSGHALLVSRVKNKNILQFLYSPISTIDFWTKTIINESSNLCGDTLSKFDVVIGNIGLASTSQTKVFFSLNNLTTGIIYTDSITLLNAINPCEFDTVTFLTNTTNKGEYFVVGKVQNPDDTNHVNDSSAIQFTSIGYPTRVVKHDTICKAGVGQVQVVADVSDTTYWYLNQMDPNFFTTGSVYQTPYLVNTSTWFTETIRGNLYFSNTLETTHNSNVNWNGTMFDLVGSADIVIDSFDVKFAATGSQIVEVYYKTGTHQGFELDASAWTLLGFKSVDVTSTTDFTPVSLGNLSVLNGDTIGIYIQLANPSSRLSYLSVSSPITRSNAELTIITGSGISHNNSNSFYPRDWSGSVYYHFGYRPKGECATNREPATVYVSQTNFNIGTDTILDIEDSITFFGPAGMNSYLWFDGSTNQDLHVLASDLGKGIHYVTLEVEDVLKCMINDELVLAIADLVSVRELGLKSVKVYPNPAHNFLVIDAERVEDIQIISSNGVVVFTGDGNGKIDVSGLNIGVYVLKIRIQGESFIAKFIKN